MPILDYDRTTRPDPGGEFAHWIEIPPWHTGALGFLPGKTEVWVHLQPALRSKGLPRNRPAHCELYVIPFPTNPGRMFRLECTLRDQPGVVYRVLSAIAAMGANIVKQDSCTFYGGPGHGFLHFVDLVIDWSEAENYRRPIRVFPSDLWCYRALRDRIPTHDARYVQLFELLLLHSFDIDFDKAHESRLPSIRITPFSFRSEDRVKATRMLLTGDKPLHVKLGLTHNEVDTICERTGRDPTKPLSYVLSADGESRTLRVLFLSSERSQLLWVGFRHKDEAGVLAAIARVLLDAGLNIQASILRKESRQRCMWEVGLEPFGEDVVNTNENTGALEFVADALRRAVVPTAVIRKCSEAEVTLGPPAYSSGKSKDAPDAAGQFPKQLAALLDADSSPPSEFAHTNPNEEVQTRYGAMVSRDTIAAAQQALQTFVDPDKRDIYGRVLARFDRLQPLIFLSYSFEIKELAEQLKSHAQILQHFRVADYQAKDWHDFFNQSIHRIRMSDVFVGLWSVDPEVMISPWLPFEYGVAEALGKPSLLALEQTLHERIKTGLRPNVGFKEYTRASFGGEFLDDLAAQLLEMWNRYRNEATGLR
jgi:hypothetical protein